MLKQTSLNVGVNSKEMRNTSIFNKSVISNSLKKDEIICVSCNVIIKARYFRRHISTNKHLKNSNKPITKMSALGTIVAYGVDYGYGVDSSAIG